MAAERKIVQGEYWNFKSGKSVSLFGTNNSVAENVTMLGDKMTELTIKKVAPEVDKQEVQEFRD